MSFPKKEEGVILHKKVILEITEKGIYFKGIQNYHALLLLDNSSLIKCSYLVEDEKHNLLVIKVYNFDDSETAEDFVSNVNQFKTMEIGSIPKIVEAFFDKVALHVVVVEEYIPCLSIKIFLEQATKIEGVIEKMKDNLILHKLLIAMLDSLYQLEENNTYHGFINASNLCIRPLYMPRASTVQAYIDAIIEDFGISICDIEAQLYLACIDRSKKTQQSDTIWKNLLANHLLIEAPEFKSSKNVKSNLSLKYDMWMVGVIIIEIVSHFTAEKTANCKYVLEALASSDAKERKKEIHDFVGEPTLNKILIHLFQDFEERPLPSEALKLPEVQQAQFLINAEQNPIAKIGDHHFEYEPLVSGIMCKSPAISRLAVGSLVRISQKDHHIFEKVLHDSLYYPVISHLKFIRTLKHKENTPILEDGLRFLTKIIETDPRLYANELIVAGAISLVVGLIEYDIDHKLLCNFFIHYGHNCTGTFLHFVEKAGLIQKIVSQISSLNEDWEYFKRFYLDTAHFYKTANVIDADQFIPEMEYFELLLRVPIAKRNDAVLFKLIKKLIVGYAVQLLQEPNKDLARMINRVLFSWIIKKNILIYTSSHLQCFEGLMPPDMLFPYSSGFFCTTCSQVYKVDTFVCSVCAFYCHKDHIIYPAGYQYAKCKCSTSNKCMMKAPHEIPDYLTNQTTNYLDSLKMSFDRIPKNFKGELAKNIFVNMDGEIGTLVSSNPLCTIQQNSSGIIDVDKTIGYFEADIKLGGFYDQIAVGFATSSQYPFDEFAGYLDGSIAFHGDDGKIFLNGKIVGNLCSFGSHDIVGCGITNNGFVYFTHNGNLMYEYKTNFRGAVYPLVSLRGKYSSVQINFEGGFLFNYEDFREILDSKDYVKFVSPIVLESILINSDWIQILQKLYEIDNAEWLGQVITYLKNRREKPLAFKESEIKEEKIFEDKNFDILKELQSIDILLRESKRSVKEFTMGDNEAYKFAAINESDYTDIHKSPVKSILSYSDARNYMSIQVNEPNVMACNAPNMIQEKKVPPKKKKSSVYGCGPKKGKCNIF